MKKTFLMATAGLALISLAACSNKSCDNGSCSNGKGDRNEVFTGVLPAADCDGIRYTLHLDYDDNGKDGDYKLVETYLRQDSTGMAGIKDIASFASEGDFVVSQDNGKTIIKLVKDQKDSGAGSVETPIYFIANGDSTLTLTNDSLKVPDTPGLNYTLRRSK
ncbi:MAG: copper resistance protein NlpE [Bacteroidales bacterium]|nr:copper resistance protein NlpE [Bacteroidales bacterium]